MYNPSGIVIDTSLGHPAIYVSDTVNNRVLGWRDANVLPGQPADVILGQLNQYQTFAGGPGTPNSYGLSSPTGLAVDPVGNLYVSDSNNNRILRFPTPFVNSLTQTTPIQPDLVIGQPTYSSNTPNHGGISAATLNLATGGSVPLLAGLAFDSAGSLYVSDVGNHRVLAFPASTLKTQNNGPSATLVLGQPSFIANAKTKSATAPDAFSLPSPITIDYKGRLYVADSLNRVLVFLPPFKMGATAARFVGFQTQAATAPGQNPAPALPSISNSTIGYPQGLAMAGTRLVICDASDSRVLVFDPYESWPDPSVAISPAAYEIIGQAGYGDHSPNRGTFVPSAATLSFPLGAAASSTEVFIADGGNNRIGVYEIQGGLPQLEMFRIIGQNFPNTNSPNVIEGREFNLTTSNGVTGTVLIDRNSTPPHLYVSDPGNNRILGFNDALHVAAGDVADIVIGQATGFTGLANFPSGDPTKPQLNSLNAPAGMALDASGNLWVADSGNGRVLRFPAPFAHVKQIQQSADMVIGQTSFTSKITSVSPSSLATPVGVAVTSDGSLLVADGAFNRVLYYAQPLVSAMAATKVIGQSDFYSATPNGTPADPARFTTPVGLAVDSLDRIYVCDAGGGRVSIFGPPNSIQTTYAQPLLLLTQGLAQPVGLAIGPPGSLTPDELWIADAQKNEVLHYPPYSQTVKANVSDGMLPVTSPLAVTYDTFYNPVVADATSRILFYVPTLAVVNGANYLTRAVAPGTIVSVFPSPSNTPTVFGSTTANFTDLASPLPLPTSIGDTQVLIDQQPAAVFYVSPKQINLPLPLNLPTSGTVDFRVVNKSTGQIYAASDVSVTAVSPGMFSLNSTGTGQLLALNEDNSVNGAGNPLTRGHVIQFFGTGQGAVSNAPPDGTPATGLAPTVLTPQIQIGSITIPPENILYSGLAPGLIGVWQIDVLVPTTVTANYTVPVIITLGSIPAYDPASTLKATIALQ